MYIDEIAKKLKRNLKDSDICIQLCKDEGIGYMEVDHRVFGFMYRIPFKALYVSQCEMTCQNHYLNNKDYRAIDKTIKQILKTPATKLLAEPKYIVMPDNLDSSHGPQLLSTDSQGRIFFAAKVNGLKQTFTHDELQELIYRHADGAETSWLTSVINQYKKLVY